MNFTDFLMTVTNTIAYLLDHLVETTAFLLFCLWLHQMAKSDQQKREFQKLNEEFGKIKTENEQLKAHADIGKSLMTTIKALKN